MSYVYTDLDTFNGIFRPSIFRSNWGHGESGFCLVIFSTHSEEEAKKALACFCDVSKNINENLN